jgi:hypothetical protein
MRGEGFAFFRWRALLKEKHGWLIEPLPSTNKLAMRAWCRGFR